MATTKGQRIGIWVIAGMMFLGTVGGFDYDGGAWK